MTALETEAPSFTADGAATAWIKDFATALEAGDSSALESQFLPGATFRDFLALQMDLKTFREPEVISNALTILAKKAGPSRWRLDPAIPAVLLPGGGDVQMVLAAYLFETTTGSCSSVAMLVSMDGGVSWKSTAFFTKLESLTSFPETTGANRPQARTPGVVMGRVDWLTRRKTESEYTDREPAVVILGSGHAGLMLAARLKALGVPTLIIERNPRVGDNWRNRYSALYTHDLVKMDHFPYMPFPTTWTHGCAKDRLANWMEYYAEALELDVWTGSEVTSCTLDESTQQWTLEVRRADGSTRRVHPRHFVPAVGMNGFKRMPTFAGQDEFEGKIVHSGDFDGGANWKGKHVLVVGGGTSGNDIIQDAYEQGAKTTMLLRSSGNTVEADTFHQIFMGTFLEEGPEAEVGDNLVAFMPYDKQIESSRGLQAAMNERDAAMRAGLEAAGFKVDSGTNDDGPASGFRSGRMSYYFNYGAADLIVDGRVPVIHGTEIDHLTRTGAVLADGRTIDQIDLIVCATGYGPTLEAATPTIGEELAARVKVVYELGRDGEMLNVWRRTPVPGLWFMLGTLQQSRFHSKVLALQIKAVEEGLIPWESSVETPEDEFIWNYENDLPVVSSTL